MNYMDYMKRLCVIPYHLGNVIYPHRYYQLTMSELRFKLHKVFVKSTLLQRFYEVTTIQQLRSYNKGIYLYRSCSPFSIPMNTDMVILNEKREMLRPHVIRVGEYHPLLGKRLA